MYKFYLGFYLGLTTKRSAFLNDAAASRKTVAWLPIRKGVGQGIAIAPRYH